MHCNIDAKGKQVRLINGIVMVVVGILLAALWAMPYREPIAWGVAALFLAVGAFCIFEARAGWCVMRAMGFKTKY